MNEEIDVQGFQANALLRPIRLSLYLVAILVWHPALAGMETADQLTAQRNAETRAAIAEAERAELLARLPPPSPPPSRSRAASTPGSSAPPAWSRPSTSHATWHPKSAQLSPPTVKPPSTNRPPPRACSQRDWCLKLSKE
jgi:hypothetical protein